MSGPKGIAYQVQAAAEARRRALAEARARYDVQFERLTIAQQRLAALMSTPAPVRTPTPDLESPESCVAAERSIVAVLRRVEEQETQAHLRLVEDQLALQFGELHAFTLEPWDTSPPRVAQEPVTSPHARANGAASLQRLVVRLQQLEFSDDLHEMFSRADRLRRAINEGDVVTMKQQFVVLQTDVDTALREQAARARLRERADQLVLTLADVAGEAGDRLRAEAAAASSAATLDSLDEQVSTVLAQHRAEQDRAYVIEQTRRSLLDLGYEVGEEFLVHGLDGEAAVVTRPELPDYGLRVQFTRNAPRILTRVVAFSATDALRDEEVESSTCRDIDHLRDDLARDGVTSTLDHHRDPGEVPLTRTAPPRRTRTRQDRSRPL